MVAEIAKISIPTTLAEFQIWESEDGFKYEWNDGELIKFVGLNKRTIYIYANIFNNFAEKNLLEIGTLISKFDVMLCGTPPTGIQLRRPDIAFLTKEQVQLGKHGEDVIPEFVIEIISESDNYYKIEEKITEYFKAGVKIIWNIVPEHKLVYVYSSRKTVKICSDDDICSAEPVLPDFSISVNEIFG